MTDYLLAVSRYLDEERLRHSINTAEVAAKLAERYGEDAQKAYTAGLLHDVAKCMDDRQAYETAQKYGIKVDAYCQCSKELLHGILGAAVARRELGVRDEEVLSAIACHTTGKKGMSLLDKIVYIADLIEPLRAFEGVEEIRALAFEDIDLAVMTAARNIVNYVMRRGLIVHPDTIDAYNDIARARRASAGRKEKDRP